MPGTVREHSDHVREYRVRLVTRVLCVDSLLAEPVAPWAWHTERLYIGRGDRNVLAGDRLTLDDGRVSGRHAEVWIQGGRPWVKDVGSSNGTWLNGRRVDGPAALEPNDLLEVGRTLLSFGEAPAPLAAQLCGGGVSFGAIRTFSPAFAQMLLEAARAARTAEPVLILGETGTGKDVLARSLHQESGRKGPFVAVDAGAIPDTLFESTLFGHERGAFTGATEARTGELVRAHRGTLFLDEVGNLSPASQARLLRVLETGRVSPLGARESVEVDVRVVSATNRAVLGADAGFREDLLHRLSGFILSPVPLRERREDLGILARALLADAGVERASMSLPAARQLFSHPLTGNVRQLRNVLRRAGVGHREVHIDRLEGLEVKPPAPSRAAPERPKPARPRGTLPSREEVEAALTASHGSVAAAARALGTYPRQLYRWLDELGIRPDDFRK